MVFIKEVVMRKIDLLLGLPKSIWFNFCEIPFRDAIKLPVVVSWRTKFKSLKGKVKIDAPIKTAMVRIGMDGSGTASYQPVVIENNGTLVFQKGVSFGGGGQICTMNSESVLSVHSNTKFMGEYHIVAEGHIEIGSGCAVSWNTQIMDTDIHKLIECESIVNKHKDVVIGNHVWIGSRVTIGKGVSIPNDTIVACDSLILKSFDKEKCAITGMPIKVIKKEVDWEM